MPKYTFKHIETGELKVENLSYSEVNGWLDKNPEYERVFNPPEVNLRGTGTTGTMINSPEHIEALRKAHQGSPKSDLGDTSGVLRKHGTGE